ncbi:2-dehydropantoate 2-reductase [Malassezia cuniculi]|uniref:2-dehydropantoate 2-reductase n=1 Tax=Malassezia cuniculi TaxID=948313 RepID=A0AAF0EVJ0_9BASI|nr:2-dehydropantoate 2-reductase [Malassezia cuniculi]
MCGTGGAEVTAACRSNYNVVREKGITVQSGKLGYHPNWHPTRVVKSADEVDVAFDYLAPASEIVRPYLESHVQRSSGKLPLVVMIQNGVDIEEEMYRTLVATDKPLACGIASGLTWVGTTLLDNGTRIEHGNFERFEVGFYPLPRFVKPDAEAERLLDEFIEIITCGGSTVVKSDDIEALRWSKILWNTSWGGVCLLSRQPVAEILRPEVMPYTCGVARSLMCEVMAVARANGIDESRLPMSRVDDVYNMTQSQSTALFVNPADPSCASRVPTTLLPDDFKPSILVDLERGRPTELEPIFCNIAARARRTGVPTPHLDTIIAAVKPYQAKLIASLGHKATNEYHVNPRANAVGGAPVI